jgi:hypothetical protein
MIKADIKNQTQQTFGYGGNNSNDNIEYVTYESLRAQNTTSTYELWQITPLKQHVKSEC